MILTKERNNNFTIPVEIEHEILFPRNPNEKSTWKEKLGYVRSLEEAEQSIREMVDKGSVPCTAKEYTIGTKWFGKSVSIKAGDIWSMSERQEAQFWKEEALRVAQLPESEKTISGWVVDEHCALRHIVGKNPHETENRVAFIEKTARIKLIDGDWHSGHRGSGGCDGHIPENEIYGFDPESRNWVTKKLKELGYILIEDEDKSLSDFNDVE